MNKNQELAALTGFIESLPRDSYLRPALADSVPFFASTMAADIEFDFAGRLRYLAGETRIAENECARVQGLVKTAEDKLSALRRDTLRAQRELESAIAELETASRAISSALIGAKRDLKQSAA